eukprot:6617961-Alexandrium_andersonii.AAC.1
MSMGVCCASTTSDNMALPSAWNSTKSCVLGSNCAWCMPLRVRTAAPAIGFPHSSRAGVSLNM